MNQQKEQVAFEETWKHLKEVEEKQEKCKALEKERSERIRIKDLENLQKKDEIVKSWLEQEKNLEDHLQGTLKVALEKTERYSKC